ncbi:MAG: hypothetical protein H6825_02735 [Planctomycetes bacterium]|nr:hypothetical protein [Planctomycetota bacterium]
MCARTNPLWLPIVLVASLAPGVFCQAPVSKVTADGTSLIGFGEAVALDGDTALSFGTLPDHEGRAVVLARRDSGWVVAALLPFVPVGSPAAGLKYGKNVALVGDTAFVGATGDTDLGAFAGIGHVYQRDDHGTPTPFDDEWIEIDQLIGGDTGAQFGFAVAAQGERVVVGGPGQAADRGWARLFVRDDAGTPSDPFDDRWTTFVDLEQPGAPAQSLFGFDVALSGDLVAVSDPLGDGRVSTWMRVGDDWLPDGTLEPQSADAGEFGWSIALDGDTLLVGHRGDGLTGSASFFRHDDGGTPSDPQDDQWLPDGTFTLGSLWGDFGHDVVLDGDRALVSAVTLSSFFELGGRVVEYRRSDGAWTQSRVLAATDEVLGDRFGWSLALDGATALLGTKGDHDVDGGSGAVWILDLDADDPWVDEGHASPGPEKLPRLVGWGVPVDAHVMSVKLLDASVGDSAWLVLGDALALLPFKGGVLVPAPLLALGPLDGAPSPQGQLVIPWSWPREVPSGAQLVLQAWMSHASLPGWSASNGLSITMP